MVVGSEDETTVVVVLDGAAAVLDDSGDYNWAAASAFAYWVSSSTSAIAPLVAFGHFAGSPVATKTSPS